MQKNYRKNLVQSLMAGVAGVAILATAGTAQAAIVNSLSFVSAQPLGPNSCQVNYNGSVTGVINDAANYDYILLGHVTSTGSRNNAPSYFVTPVGVTQSLNGSSLGISPTQRGTYFVVIYETDSSGNQGAELARSPIPRATLIAAGGSCRGLVTNVAPTINAGPDQNLAGGGGAVTLNAIGNDGDNDTITYSWTQISGPSVTLSGASTASASFTAPVQTNQARSMTFRVTASDGIAAAVTDDVIVNIPAGPNTLPVANAGADANVTPGMQAALGGSASDVDGDPLTYQWSQVSGTPVTLTSANTAVAQFIVPASNGSAQQLTFRLIANDGFGNSAPDTVVYTIPANSPPTVNAGAYLNVAAGAPVMLTGTANDFENNPLTYLWTQTAGPSAALSGATTLTPGFVAPAKSNAVQTLTFSLTANDGTSTSSADTVNVSIAANVGPTANAGTNTIVGGGTTGTLNGGASSDGDGDPLSYQWSQTSGPSVTLNGATTATPSFTAPPRQVAAQTLTFSLVVSDGIASSAPASVTVTIPSNAAPTVNAGNDATVAPNARISLAGTSSDPENDPVSYIWTQTAGPVVALAGSTTTTPSFTAPQKTASAQVLTFQLIGSDGTSNSAPDSVDITVPANSTPLSNAGPDATVQGGALVTLDGRASADGDGDPLTYSWVQASGPSVTLAQATSARPSFTAPVGGIAAQTLVFNLMVSDGVIASVADSVTITVNPNGPPVANAGPDQGPINTGASVVLNGSASTDPDGNALTYRWTQISGPTATLSNANAANPTFIAPNVNGTQNLVFQLIVNDGTVDSPPDTVVIAVRAVGTVTIIQRVVGVDSSFSYTSDIAALTGAIATISGIGQRAASLVPAGAHNITAGDARAAGYALTSISCNDADSVVNLAGRSVAIALSPNENLVCTFTSANTRDAATVAIGNFLTARNAAILASAPDLQRRLERLNGATPSAGMASAYGILVPATGRLPVALNANSSQIHAATSLGMARTASGDSDRGAASLDIWAEATFSQLTYGNQRGSFNLIYAGADYRMNRNLLLGALVQFDRFAPRDRTALGAAGGNGWMAGPYVMLRMGPQLFVDVRAAWGNSSNSVSPLGSYIDHFSTNRALYSGAVSGQFNLGKNWQFRPEFALRYIEDKQKAYIDSYGVAIPNQKIGQGDVSFHPRLQYVVAMDKGGYVKPYISAEGIYSFGLDPINALGTDFRMRVEGGADFFTMGGISAGVSGYYDGIGTKTYHSSGAKLRVSMGF
ncbi:MAG: Chitinase precursor [Pseudomonadota bacterium]